MKKLWALLLTGAMVLGLTGVNAPVYAAGESQEDSIETEAAETAAEDTANETAAEDAAQDTEAWTAEQIVPDESLVGEDEAAVQNAADDALIFGDPVGTESEDVETEVPEETDEIDEMLNLDGSGIYVDDSDPDYTVYYLLPGEAVTLTSSYAGREDADEFSYQWSFTAGVNDDEHLISGETSAAITLEDPKTGNYIISATREGDTEYENYRVEVRNGLQAVCPDTEADVYSTLTVKVNVMARDLAGITYRWCYLTLNDEYEAVKDYIDGADQRTYTIDRATPDNTANLWCEVTDAYGNVCDAQTYISLDDQLKETNTENNSFKVAPGESVTLEADVEAIDDSCLTYQWYLCRDAGDSLIDGADQRTYTIDNVMYSGSYYCEVTSPYNENQAAFLYFDVVVDNGFEASYGEECSAWNCGNVGETIELSVDASADQGSISYTWYQLEDYADWENGVELENGNDPVLSTTVTSDIQYYSVIAADEYGNSEDFDFVVEVHEWECYDYEPAELTADGCLYYCCDNCTLEKTVTICHPQTYTFSPASYTYDGKSKAPVLTIRNSKGQVISSKYYTVTKTYGKNIGTYSYKVVFSGLYSGTKAVYYTINPVGTSLTKVTASSKGFKAYWKKQARLTTGYQIRYSTSSDMGKAKTVTISKTGTTYTTVKKLTGKKKYYVQVRTYKTVSGKNYFSDWSSTETVTTKK